MKKKSKGSSLFSSGLGLFDQNPKKTKSRTTKKASATPSTKRKKQTVRTQPQPYRAAEIKPTDLACDAAKQLAEVRFLLADVPHLPLPECTSTNCKCTYVRHKDRRDLSDDRRAYYSLRTNLYTNEGNDERRKRTDRRADAESASSRYGSKYEFKDMDRKR